VHPGTDKVVLYANTFEKLKLELPRKRIRPTKVYFCPSCDLFQPVQEVLTLGYQVLEHLLENDVGVAILTKGKIPNEHMKLLCRYPGKVEMQIGLICLDEDIRQVFEGRTASPATRLAQIERLTSARIPVQVRIDPILPGLADSAAQFDQLCENVSKRGVTTLAASTLFLRPAIRGSLRKNISDSEMYDRLMGHFKQACRLQMHAENSPALALPAAVRKQIYHRLIQVASRYGLQVNVCACKNTDLPQLAVNCQITGNWEQNQANAEQQATLFQD